MDSRDPQARGPRSSARSSAHSLPAGRSEGVERARLSGVSLYAHGGGERAAERVRGLAEAHGQRAAERLTFEDLEPITQPHTSLVEVSQHLGI